MNGKMSARASEADGEGGDWTVHQKEQLAVFWVFSISEESEQV